MAKYPDVSHWHPVIDWAKAKANCPFLISKATQGKKTDKTLDSFIQGCEKHGIPYWLFVFLNNGNELAQAKFLVNTCKNKVGKYFVGYILDAEKDNKAEDVKAALDYLDSLGGKTMLYTGHSDYPLYKNIIASRPSNCAWWEARYGTNNGVCGSAYPCHDGVDLHQFTSKGTCEGIKGKCDLNRICKKGKEWFTTPLKKDDSEKEAVKMGKYASKVIEQARAWLGKKESNGTFKEIIDTYNAHKPLARGYTVKYTDEWCATFVSAVAIKLGYTSIIPKECSCQKMIDLFKIMGCWVEDENRTPNAGDVIFYDWQDNGSGDNKGWSDHVGIVESVSNGKITVIEGNYNCEVKRRTLDVNGRYIRGYGVPRYDAEVVAENATTNTAPTTPTASKKAKHSAKSFLASLAGTYEVTATWLNVREGAGTEHAKMVAIPKGTKVKNYGYYTAVNGTKWLYVQFVYNDVTYTGFASGEHLEKQP